MFSTRALKEFITSLLVQLFASSTEPTREAKQTQVLTPLEKGLDSNIGRSGISSFRSPFWNCEVTRKNDPMLASRYNTNTRFEIHAN